MVELERRATVPLATGINPPGLAGVVELERRATVPLATGIDPRASPGGGAGAAPPVTEVHFRLTD